MNPSVIMLSSHEITREELAGLLLKAGGYIPKGGSFGLISNEERYIWIHAGDASLREFLADYLDVLKQDAPGVLEQIRAKLGAEPQTYFEVEIRNTPGSQQLAVDFACLCAKIWPCVVIVSHPRKVFSNEEILQLCKEGKGMFSDEI